MYWIIRFSSKARVFIRKNTIMSVELSILAFVIGTALFPESIATHDPVTQDSGSIMMSPNGDHYFGTDWAGRDVFSRVVHGSSVSLYIGLISVALASVIGISVGMLSAYKGGYIDLIIQRVTDIFLGFPAIVMALVIIVSMGSSQNSISLAIAIGMAPQVVRLSRSSALSVKENLYIDAIESVGANPSRIIFMHLLPNSFPVILSQITGYLGVAIVAETTLSFLGLGMPPPYPSWGRMIQEGSQKYMESAPWVTIFPGAALSITVITLLSLGDSIRDLIGPKDRPA